MERKEYLDYLDTQIFFLLELRNDLEKGGNGEHLGWAIDFDGMKKPTTITEGGKQHAALRVG